MGNAAQSAVTVFVTIGGIRNNDVPAVKIATPAPSSVVTSIAIISAKVTDTQRVTERTRTNPRTLCVNLSLDTHCLG